MIGRTDEVFLEVDKGKSGDNALVKRTSDHRNQLLPDTTFIISSVAYEDNSSVILSDHSRQPTRSALNHARSTPKWTHFSELTPTTFLQLNNTLFANSKKCSFHKSLETKGL